jgi:hypothetical protein
VLTAVVLLGTLGAPLAGATVVPGVRPCAPGDPYQELAVDVRRRRVTLCRASDPAALRRQLLAAAVLLDDETAGWSRDPAWRRLNGWSRSLLGRWTARNRAPLATAAPSGRRSPAWDLATFAAEWIVEHTGAPGDDPPLTCRLLPQARFVHQRLLASAALPARLRAPPRCAAYEAWARRAALARIELVLATPRR